MTIGLNASLHQSSDCLDALIDSATGEARMAFGRQDAGGVVVSPYRFNPLGAHVDHQGGPAMARTIDQYSLLPFWPEPESSRISLCTPEIWLQNRAEFNAGELTETENWIRYAQAAAAVLAAECGNVQGYQGYVMGTLVGAGLSSSASVVLAYLSAMLASSNLGATPTDLVEWSRRVENDYLGLKNGIQDQMSVVYGRDDALSLLDNRAATASWIADSAEVSEVRWILCYSGISRELINSDFNLRVAECRDAARLLDAKAEILGDVDRDRGQAELASLPKPLASRARHFFTETARVAKGSAAWKAGDWRGFGELMNASCHSSITQYQCGSQPLIDLHGIASSTAGVYGSRFSGGGYGGCLVALADKDHCDAAAELILEEYLKRYPEYEQARAFVANSESGVRVVPMPEAV